MTPPASPGLQNNLKRRHLAMIAIAGVIGAGLFVGSGAVIQQAGPAAILSYACAGAIVVQAFGGNPEANLGSGGDRAVSKHLVQRAPADADVCRAVVDQPGRGHLGDHRPIRCVDRDEVEADRRGCAVQGSSPQRQET